MTAPTWSSVRDQWKGQPALVVGNGPSRIRKDRLVQLFPGHTFGCNSFWRHLDLDLNPDDVLVCYDHRQIADAITEHWAPRPEDSRYLLCASQPGILDPKPAAAWSPHRHGKILVADPMARILDWSVAEDPNFAPVERPVGNFAGFMAFQLAWHMGCNPIWTLGIDGAGKVDSEGWVHLSACDRSWQGYDGQRLRVQECYPSEVEGWATPKGWNHAVILWHHLFRAREHQGLETYRLAAGGVFEELAVRAGPG